MNTARSQKMLHEAMANESDQRINQLKLEAASAQEQDEEHEIVFDDDATETMNNTSEDFH